MPIDLTNLLADRAKTHGDFLHHALITQELKEVIHNPDRYGNNFWAELNVCQQETLDMIAHKIGRILAGDPNFRDHWIDIAGYAILVANRCTK
jgi:hypothetical protein